MTQDSLLHQSGRQESLSEAYVHAVAAAAGYTTAAYNRDMIKADVLIQAGGYLSPLLAIQLKATIRLRPVLAQDGEEFSFQLDAATYEVLRSPGQIPRLLVVMDLPRSEDEWVSITTEELVMRHCAYWLSLKDAPATNRTAPTVRIPKSHVFDVPGIRQLMEQSRDGSL
jgi:hypothetical protein